MVPSSLLPDRPRVLIAADQLSECNIRTLAGVLDGWAEWRRVPQTLSDAELTAQVMAADIVVGWAPTPALRDGRTLVYLCGSNGIDAYVGHGLGAKRGFLLCNAGDVMSATIAEHCLALLLAATRELPAILRQQDAHQWQRRWNARELAGSTVCIVGLGGSGQAIARRCLAFDMRVIGVRRDVRASVPGVHCIYGVNALGDAVAEADHVVAVVPGGAGTRHLFNPEIFDRMRRHAWFYSLSRGSVTDEKALIAALAEKRIGGAALDVFESEPLPPSHPLWAMPNTIVSPHSAGLSVRLSDRLTAHFVDNLQRLRRGEDPGNRIDLHRLEAPLV